MCRNVVSVVCFVVALGVMGVVGLVLGAVGNLATGMQPESLSLLGMREDTFGCRNFTLEGLPGGKGGWTKRCYVTRVVAPTRCITGKECKTKADCDSGLSCVVEGTLPGLREIDYEWAHFGLVTRQIELHYKILLILLLTTSTLSLVTLVLCACINCCHQWDQGWLQTSH